MCGAIPSCGLESAPIDSTVVSAVITSCGKLTKVAPGFVEVALRNAFDNASGTLSGCSTSTLYFVIGSNSAKIIHRLMRTF